MEIINTFLENWRIKAKQYYIDAQKDYNEHKDDFKTTKEKLGNREITMLASEHRANHFINKYGKANMQIVIHEMYRIDDILEKEVQNKKRKLIKDIQEKAGNIIDAAGLYISDAGDINGFIIGDKAKVNVNTIYAGGYNIQCLHFRTLIKEVK